MCDSFCDLNAITSSWLFALAVGFGVYKVIFACESFSLFFFSFYFKPMTRSSKIAVWPGKSLRDKTVLITGGGAGIGREIALKMAKAGARIVLWDVNEAALIATKADIVGLGLGTKVNSFKVDVSNPELVYETAKKTKEEVGFVYCLVNNAVFCPFLQTFFCGSRFPLSN